MTATPLTGVQGHQLQRFVPRFARKVGAMLCKIHEEGSGSVLRHPNPHTMEDVYTFHALVPAV